MIMPNQPMNTNQLLTILLCIACWSCDTQKSGNEDTQEEQAEKSAEESTGQDKPALHESWEFLLGERWYALLKDSANGKRKHLVPACLSEGGAIEFIGERSIQELLLICGQDAATFKDFSIQASNDILKINMEENDEILSLRIKRTQTDSIPLVQAIIVETDQLNKLFHSYYPDSILALNDGGIVYITDSVKISDTFYQSTTYQYLSNNGLYRQLPCPEDGFD